jgi:hypothetical protein
VVRHRHRVSHSQLRTQLANNGIGFYAYLVRSAREWPDERLALLKLGASWYWRWNVCRLVQSMLRPGWFPRDLVAAEARGALDGPRRYAPAKRRAQQVLETFGPQTPSTP